MMMIGWRAVDRQLGLAWRVKQIVDLLPERDKGRGGRQGATLIGQRGPAGPPGDGASIQINQISPASTWVLTHTLGRRPAVDVYLTSGERIMTDVFATDTQVTVIFATPQTGYVMLS